MNQYLSEYKQILTDYRKEFFRHWEQMLFVIGVAVIGIFCNWETWRTGNFLGGIPILFSIFSSGCHRVSLPPMMYLVPADQRQREMYIQRMLYVKIAVPVGVAIICDILACFIQPLSAGVIVIQLLEVIQISAICGVVYDGPSSGKQKKAAFAALRGMEPIFCMICCISGFAVFIICMGEVNMIEFGIVVGILLLCELPAAVAIVKHWKTIRSNFADYETAVKLEDISCRW